MEGLNSFTLALARKYTDVSIEGTGGVIAGKNCQVASIEEIEGGHKITLSWYKDGETVARVESFDVMDGEEGPQGPQGEKGEEGFSPEVTIAEQSADTYILHIKTEDEEFDTPNLKGMGGYGVDVGVKDENLIFTY